MSEVDWALLERKQMLEREQEVVNRVNAMLGNEYQPSIAELNQKVVDVVFRYIDSINDPIDHDHLVKMVIDFGKAVDPLCNQIVEAIKA